MGKEFVNYEQALTLKELGFNEQCIGYINKLNEEFIYDFERHPNDFIKWCGGNVIKAPTFSQAFRWFRDNHDLEGDVTHFNDNKFKWSLQVKNITNNPEESKILFSHPFFESYEEAESACLNKLIEIVKEKK